MRKQETPTEEGRKMKARNVIKTSSSIGRNFENTQCFPMQAFPNQFGQCTVKIPTAFAVVSPMSFFY